MNNHEKHIEEIVNIVLYGYFRIENYKDSIKKNGKESVLIYDVGSEYKDERREFKNAITDIVVKEFLKDPIYSIKFIKLIYDTIYECIQFYLLHKSSYVRGLNKNDIIFLYKGGNVLRTVAREFIKENVGINADLLETVFGGYFQRSDADFTIYINPRFANMSCTGLRNMPNLFDEITDDMQLIAYLAQNYIRNIVIQNKSEWFNYYQLSDDSKKKTLRKYLNELNNGYTLKENEESPYYGGKFTKIELDNISVTDDVDNVLNFTLDPITSFGVSSDISAKYDIHIDNPDGDKNKIIVSKLTPIHLLDKNANISLNDLILEQKQIYGNIDRTSIYISSNTTNTFDNEDIVASFTLIRSKVNAKLHFVSMDGHGFIINAGGELIDVSIPKIDDTQLPTFFEELNHGKIVERYSMMDVNNNAYFTFYSYDVHHLVKDLELILFLTVRFPWADVKYKKRMMRLVFLHFILLMDQKRSLDNKALYLGEFRRFCTMPLQEYEHSIANIDLFLEKKKIDTSFDQLAHYIKKILLNAKQDKLQGEDKKKLNQFLEIIKEAIEKLILVLGKNAEIVDTEMRIPLEYVTQHITQYGGSKFNKEYLECKKKYIAIKNKKG